MEIRFVLRLNVRDKKKPATIYCRITVNGQRAGDFSTFEHVLPDEWHSKGQVAISGTEEASITNEALANITNELRRIYLRLKNQPDTPLSALAIKAEYLQKDQPSRTFVEIFQSLLDRKAALKRAKGTLDDNRYKFANIKAFLKEKGKEQLLPAQFTESLADDLEFWLRTHLTSCGIEHVAKHLQLIKEALKLAVKKGDISKNPLADLTVIRQVPKRVIFLTLEEVKRLQSYRFATPILQQTADLFIFCCYTGLSHQDVISFSPDLDIRTGVNGEAWIYKERGKTDVEAQLPFFDRARQILHKYGGKLPFIRNDHYNNYLKQIMAMVGISVHVTTHTARKTAANIWHNEGGLSMDDVALMMGHADPKTTRKYYVQTDSRKIAEAAERLKRLLA